MAFRAPVILDAAVPVPWTDSCENDVGLGATDCRVEGTVEATVDSTKFDFRKSFPSILCIVKYRYARNLLQNEAHKLYW
jgi:hypothetical protein